ncbi:MAG: SGNH/GDSL hydrolase family protein [Burkholderiales bacterium]|nr:SGNH/GDSL hydrolase family protein [Burkholderiales bacterium]
MQRATIIRAGDIDARFPDRNPDHPKYALKVLAEGDSWFTVGSIPGSNLLFHVEAKRPTALVSIAKPGDTIVRMGDPDRMRQLSRLIANPRFSYAWDAILISGGGNDLIDSAPNLLIHPATPSNDPGDYVDSVALKLFISTIHAAYANIVQVRDSGTSKSRGKPIYLHTYDYPTPRNSPTRFLGAGILGPWLYPAFLLEGIPVNMWIAVSDYLLNRLAEALLALDTRSGSDPLPEVFVIDTRNTLTRARLGTPSSDGDWANEIHPNTAGYRKLGRKVTAAMQL